jgi:hypothetical protein
MSEALHAGWKSYYYAYPGIHIKLSRPRTFTLARSLLGYPGQVWIATFTKQDGGAYPDAIAETLFRHRLYEPQTDALVSYVDVTDEFTLQIMRTGHWWDTGRRDVRQRYVLPVSELARNAIVTFAVLQAIEVSPDESV